MSPKKARIRLASKLWCFYPDLPFFLFSVLSTAEVKALIAANKANL